MVERQPLLGRLPGVDLQPRLGLLFHLLRQALANLNLMPSLLILNRLILNRHIFNRLTLNRPTLSCLLPFNLEALHVRLHLLGLSALPKSQALLALRPHLEQQLQFNHLAYPKHLPPPALPKHPLPLEARPLTRYHYPFASRR